MISKQGQQIALDVLEESKVVGIDPMTILTILSIIIQLIKFVYPYFSELNNLPFWKKAVIRFKLVSKFGFKKAREIESVMYKRVSKLTKEQADALINLVV